MDQILGWDTAVGLVYFGGSRRFLLGAAICEREILATGTMDW
ncbi:MAG: hypothetical protein ACOC6O_00775 [Chloroflexota bacterium]